MKLLPRKYFFILMLAAVTAFISYQNYTPDTFISGWDTLHPEFDFRLNFKRMVFGVWRSEQGLGAVSGHSHMSDLPRLILLWLLHFLFPIHALKYVYVFFCLFFGPAGMYFLVRYICRNKNYASLSAFLSSLFYILNLSTVQQFYVPFEMFPTHYAFLPWIILTTLQFLEKGTKKNLSLFAFVILFASPQAYAAHLWYAFFIVWSSFIVLYSILQHKNTRLRQALILVILMIALNSYWLLPNLYFVKTSSVIPRIAKQNRLFSQEYLMRNREYGRLKEIALLKGFYFSWNIYDFTQEKFTDLLPQWSYHTKRKEIQLIGYALFSAVVAGLILALIQKNKLMLSFAPVFIIPFALLMNNTYPFRLFFESLLGFPLFEEALRFVFTKFSILLMLAYAIYFAHFLQTIFQLIKRHLAIVISFAVISILIFFMSPIFERDNLISSKVKIQIPNEYFALWNFMRTQKDGTILSLPLYNFPGWQYYQWGYQGAGFIWFGLEQPILDRDFDRWSKHNEQAFREFHYALYAENATYFAKNLQKYNIRYILWDKNVIVPYEKNRSQILYGREINNLIQKLKAQNIIQIGQFGNIVVFENTRASDKLEITNISREIAPAYQWSNADVAYYRFGDYSTSQTQNKNATPTYYYPFRTYLNKSDRLNTDLITIDTISNTYALKNTAASEFTKIVAPNYADSEKLLYTNVYIKKITQNDLYEILFDPLLPKNLAAPIRHRIKLPLLRDTLQLSINDTRYEIKHTLIDEQEPLYLGQTLIKTHGQNFINGLPIRFSLKPYSELRRRFAPYEFFIKFPLVSSTLDARYIYRLNHAQIGVRLNRQSNTLNFTSHNKQTGVYIDLSDFNHQIGYLLQFTSRNIQGLPLRICLKNIYTRICTLYDELSSSKDFIQDVFIIPPTDTNLGFGVSIDNISFGDQPTINELKDFIITPFPYHFLSEIYFSQNNQAQSTQTQQPANTKTNGRDIYGGFIHMVEIPAPISPHNTIVLRQSYAQGWRAYKIKNFFIISLPFFFGEKLKDHVLVNNWANGWTIRGERAKSIKTKIVIVFLPQYLEFLGFGLLIATLICILRMKALSR